MTARTAPKQPTHPHAEMHGEDAEPGGRSDYRAWLWIALAAVALFAVPHIPLPSVTAPGGAQVTMSAMGKTTLGILVAAVILWVSEAVPFSVTALLVFLLLPAFHVMTGHDPKAGPLEEAIRNGLGRPVIGFFIGVLILSTAFVKVGLGERAVDNLLERVGNRPERLLLAVLAIGMFLSAWVTALAAVATLFPLTMSILRRSGARPRKSNFGRALSLALCMGPLIGGMAAPTGAAPNVIALDYLAREGITVRFVDWMAIGFPAAILLVPVAWFVLLRCFPPEKDAMGHVQLSGETRPPFSVQEWAVIVIMGGAIVAWVFGPFIGPDTKFSFWQQPEWVGIVAGVLCFIPGLRILTWRDAERGIAWNALLVMAGGLAAGAAFYESGAAKYTALVLFSHVLAMPPGMRFFGVIVVVSILHLVLSSNTVTGAVAIPLMIAMAKLTSISPWLLCAPAAMTAPLALLLPTESPNGLIAYSSGYFTVKEMVRAGAWITLAAVVVVGIVLNLVVPHQTALLMAR